MLLLVRIYSADISIWLYGATMSMKGAQGSIEKISRVFTHLLFGNILAYERYGEGVIQVCFIEHDILQMVKRHHFFCGEFV